MFKIRNSKLFGCANSVNLFKQYVMKVNFYLTWENLLVHKYKHFYFFFFFFLPFRMSHGLDRGRTELRDPRPVSSRAFQQRCVKILYEVCNLFYTQFNIFKIHFFYLYYYLHYVNLSVSQSSASGSLNHSHHHFK